MQKFFEEKPRKSSKSDQITQDQSKYAGDLKSKDPNMMIRFHVSVLHLLSQRC
jgi:hypothetical protein